MAATTGSAHRPRAARSPAPCPAAELVELPDAGHFGFFETPEPFLAAVRAHLVGIDARRPPAERRAA